MSPSIGNWKFPCEAHYWIRNNRVEWSGSFSLEQVAEVERRDQEAVSRRYERPVSEASQTLAANEKSPVEGRWSKFKKRWLNW